MNEITATIILGNSDNKLTQVQWAEFVSEIKEVLEDYFCIFEFFGGSPNYMNWQNVCWVIRFQDYCLLGLKDDIKRVREGFRQDSVAWIVGEPEFI